MNKSICAVIVSFNSPGKLKNCIDNSSYQVDEIIVVDNTTNPELKDKIGNIASSEKVRFIFNRENRGLGAALNQGITHSLKNNYFWTLLLDQDSMLTENMIDEMIRSYHNLRDDLRARTAAIVPLIYDSDFNKEIHAIVTTKLLNKKIKNHSGDAFIHFQITSGSMIRNDVIENIGLMNEYFFIDFIDFDYCFRILSKGYKILQSRNALLYHSLGEKKSRLFFQFREHNDPSRLYYQIRNRLLTLSAYGKNHRSVLYSESCRIFAKFFKVLFLEYNKQAKMKMFFRGIADFLRESNRKNFSMNN
ncbi:MAG: glycosyltransferase family 2 protein [Nitrospirota bacterium]